jgi:uncharacterized protein
VRENWKIKARLIQSPVVKYINITNVLGQTQQQKSPGTLSFDIDGKTYKLDVLEGSHDDYFMILGDATNGLQTYPSGRFVYVPIVGADGTTFIDFNKSYIPPCHLLLMLPVRSHRGKISFQLKIPQVKNMTVKAN